MAVDWVDIRTADALEWRVIRETIADGIKLAIDSASSGARVYPDWIYEVDPFTLLGKVTADMKAEAGTDQGTTHCWSIGIGDARYETNAAGVPPTIGGNNSQWRWRITLDIWLFMEYGGLAVNQARAENEARLVSAWLWRNAVPMCEEFQKWSSMQPLEFSGIQPTPFADQTKVIVASGSMVTYVQEALAI